MRRLAAAACALLLAACGTLRDGRRWGEDATLAPGSERLAQAARNAASDPWTWAPLAGAGVLWATGWDNNISEWARDRTPLFGSEKHAADMSGTLRGVSRDIWLGTVLATPSGDEAGPWALDKLKGFGVEYSATWVTSVLTTAMKGEFGRERPDGSNKRGFPSTTASDAFGFSALARRNLDAIDLSPVLDTSLRAASIATSAAAGWGRVEAGKHYPSDILAGAALGNFVAVFVHDAFLGLPDDVRLTAFVDPVANEYTLGFSVRF